LRVHDTVRLTVFGLKILRPELSSPPIFLVREQFRLPSQARFTSLPPIAQFPSCPFFSSLNSCPTFFSLPTNPSHAVFSSFACFFTVQRYLFVFSLPESGVRPGSRPCPLCELRTVSPISFLLVRARPHLSFRRRYAKCFFFSDAYRQAHLRFFPTNLVALLPPSFPNRVNEPVRKPRRLFLLLLNAEQSLVAPLRRRPPLSIRSSSIRARTLHPIIPQMRLFRLGIEDDPLSPSTAVSSKPSLTAHESFFLFFPPARPLRAYSTSLLNSSNLRVSTGMTRSSASLFSPPVGQHLRCGRSALNAKAADSFLIPSSKGSSQTESVPFFKTSLDHLSSFFSQTGGVFWSVWGAWYPFLS